MERKLLLKLKQKYFWAKDRCTNPHSQRWNSYGWRWIKFIRNSFDEFLKDMWESFEQHVKEYGIKETTIDRIDSNWNYCKENCKRSTRHEQYRNRTTNHMYSYNWEEETNRTRIANKYWINASTFKNRLESWWSLEKAVETPIKKTHKEIVYNGIKYNSVKEFANAFWLVYIRTKERINKWWDLDKVINCPKNWEFLYDNTHKCIPLQTKPIQLSLRNEPTPVNT